MEIAEPIKSPGVERIAAERRRQVDAEGWTNEHDDEHNDAELASAASCYLQEASSAIWMGRGDCPVPGSAPEEWPWDPAWWKPSEDPIRNLEKAGALIAAEIDRLLRERGH